MHPKYKRMLAGMQAKEQTKPKGKSFRKRQGSPTWFVYILKCCDGTFYTGITNDLVRRVNMHNKGTASKYTRIRRPVELLYQERYQTRTEALVRECEVKSFPKMRKEELVRAADRSL